MDARTKNRNHGQLALGAAGAVDQAASSAVQTQEVRMGRWPNCSELRHSRRMSLARHWLLAVVVAAFMLLPGVMPARAGASCRNGTKVYVVVQASDVATARSAIE